MFHLRELLNYDDFTVQCHNFPDADAIASAFAVYTYLTTCGKTARLIYSGFAEITKPNLLHMVKCLSIPIEHVKEPSRLRTLVLTDCQYGQSNVAKFDADAVFVLDHHDDSLGGGCSGVVRSQLGSCSTLIWDLLRYEQFDFSKHQEVATALYYGLYTDTNSLEEISHPLDRDMRDSIEYNRQLVNMLRFNNLTLEELNIAGMALTRHTIIKQHSFAVFKSDACDQNILGFISDLGLQVEGVDVSIVYNTLRDGYKLSIRSCTREVMASEFAAYLAGGGGHNQKAGGFISKSAAGDAEIDGYIERRALEYFSSYDLIDAASHTLDVEAMDKYTKLKIPVGYVESTDVFGAGTPVLIRTLEGDSEVSASGGIYLMIGILGEVYPITEEKFRRSYADTDIPLTTGFEYSPTVKNKITGDSVELISHAKPCIALGDTHIFAAALTRNTKVFTQWNPDGYMYGRPGDQIAVRCDDHNDVYIIRRDIFEKTYAKLG